MKVSVTPAPGATVSIKTKDGKTLTTDQIESIEFVPFFSLANGPGEALVAEAKSDDGSSVYDTFVLAGSGANGKIKRLASRPIKSVVPLIDRPRQAKKQPPAAATTAAQQPPEGGGRQK